MNTYYIHIFYFIQILYLMTSWMVAVAKHKSTLTLSIDPEIIASISSITRWILFSTDVLTCKSVYYTLIIILIDKYMY